MGVELFRVKVVARDLARHEIKLKNVSLYMLVNILIGYIFGYSTLVFSTAGTGWLGWLEMLCVLLITTIGFARCSSEGDEKNFIYDYICLSVPIGFTTIFLSWSFYWSGWWLFGKLMEGVDIQFQYNLKILLWFAKDGPVYSVFLINIMINLLYFRRMRGALLKVRHERKIAVP